MRKLKFLIILSIVLIFGSCNNTKKPRLTEINFGSFSVAVDYGPYLIAKNKGWFEEAFKEKDIKINYTVFQSLPPINESFATDNIDIVFEAAPPAIVGKAAGIGLSIKDISCTLIQEILVHNDSSINQIEQLKGKKIAVLAGTSSHYGLLKILEESGISNKEVEIIDMIPPDAKNAFVTNQVNAWAVWPPWVEQEEINGTGKVLSGGDAYINSIMVVRSGFEKNHPDELKIIVDVFNKTKKWMIENPNEAIKLIAQELNLPIEVIEKAWPRHNWSVSINNNIVRDIQNKADFLFNNKFIQNQITVKDNLIINEK